MPASTSPLALPYPVAADAPAGHTQMQSLATAVQTALGSVAAGQEGVIDAGAFEVTQASGGASLVLDIASNVGSGCFVDDDGLSPARVARYYVPPTAAKSTVTLGAAHATLPRVDRVVVSMAGVVSAVAGTATSGATLDNLTGAAAVPADSLLLADALVPATDTTISNSQIRDRRKWARGAFCLLTKTAFVTGTTSTALIDGTNLNPRIECSGVPLRIAFHAHWYAVTATTDTLTLDLFIDGVAQSFLKIDSPSRIGSTNTQIVDAEWIIVPTAGSHKFGISVRSGSNTVIIQADSFDPMFFTVEEVVRQNAANNPTTTG